MSRKVGMYMRLCKRCNQTYKTYAKFGRVCDDCRLPTNNPKIKGED